MCTNHFDGANPCANLHERPSRAKRAVRRFLDGSIPRKPCRFLIRQHTKVAENLSENRRSLARFRQNRNAATFFRQVRNSWQFDNVSSGLRMGMKRLPHEPKAPVAFRASSGIALFHAHPQSRLDFCKLFDRTAARLNRPGRKGSSYRFPSWERQPRAAFRPGISRQKPRHPKIPQPGQPWLPCGCP